MQRLQSYYSSRRVHMAAHQSSGDMHIMQLFKVIGMTSLMKKKNICCFMWATHAIYNINKLINFLN